MKKSLTENKMRVLKAPEELDIAERERILFLAGSIEMGSAVDWQSNIIENLKDVKDLVILNPRRDDWDSSWVQSIKNKQFREQVEWELDGLKFADAVVMFFDKNTKSPISLLELGLLCKTQKHVIVCCPEGFYRKGNVDIVCKRYGIMQVDTLMDATKELKRYFK